MSNSRTLRTRQYAPVAVLTEDQMTAAHDTAPPGEPARPGETCVFHPDCCDPGDPACTGCGKPATSAATYHAGTAPRRFPYCGEHAEGARIAIQAITRHQASQAN